MRIDSWLSFGIGLFAAASGIAAAMFLRSMALELRTVNHGAVFFMGISVSAICMWPIGGAALGWFPIRNARMAFLVAMAIQYLIALQSVVESGEGERLCYLWEEQRWYIISFLAAYVAAQAAIWLAFWARLQTVKMHKPSLSVTESIIAIAILTLFVAPICIAARWILCGIA